MALNLALCNSFQINGEDKFCFCFKRKKKNKRKRKNVSQGQVIHDAGTLLVMPYPGEELEHLVDPVHIGQGVTDITMWNPDKTYLFSQGPNMAVFDGDHDSIVGSGVSLSEVRTTTEDTQVDSPNGSDNVEPVLTPAVKDFVDTSITQTLNGAYVNVITFWNHKAWHVHTHPLTNESLKVIGCIMITEPFNKPIRMNFNPVM